MENVEVIEEFLRPRNLGSGYGYGSGYGSGYGYGYGYGYGLKEYCGCRVWYIDGVPTVIDLVRGDYALGRIVRGDLYVKPCVVARVGNCFAHGNTLQEALGDAQAKAAKAIPLEDRMSLFVAEYPSLGTKAKCAEFYRWHHILTGSCTMGRDEFIKAHGLDMDKDYTVRYFLTITANSFADELIKQLKMGKEE